MSDILIRNMEMPKKCLTCPCLEYNMFDDDIDGYCKMLKTKITNSDKHHPNYPLIELPPHGRLIDGDKFYKVMCSKWVLLLGEAYKRLDEFLENPVIEAEGSET